MSVFSTLLKAGLMALAMSMLITSGHAAPAASLHPVWDPVHGKWDFNCLVDKPQLPTPGAVRPTHCPPVSSDSVTSTTRTVAVRPTTTTSAFPTLVPGTNGTTPQNLTGIQPTIPIDGNSTVEARAERVSVHAPRIPINTHSEVARKTMSCEDRWIYPAACSMGKNFPTAAPTGPKEHNGNDNQGEERPRHTTWKYRGEEGPIHPPHASHTHSEVASETTTTTSETILIYPPGFFTRTHSMDKNSPTAAPTGPKEHNGKRNNGEDGEDLSGLMGHHSEQAWKSILPRPHNSHTSTMKKPVPTGIPRPGHGAHGEEGPRYNSAHPLIPPHTSHTHSGNMTAPTGRPAGPKEHNDMIQNNAASVEVRGQHGHHGRPGKPDNNDNGNGNNGGSNGNNGNNGGGNTNNGGVGEAIVVNACPFSVQSNIVHAPRPGVAGAPEEIFSVLAPGQTATHAFSHDPKMGISWKVWRTDVANHSPIQFEWTYVPEQGRTWYDLSMIDAGKIAYTDPNASGKIFGDADGYGDYVGQVAVKHAFADHGMTLTPMSGGNVLTEGNCVAVRCQPGDEFCKDAYNVWNDWGQQRDCAQGASLKLTLCG
ncbi:hypothetical protein EDD37DRAFT_644346 [Exophiala viscosa]|uniref:uncharacterized protein n=1 Tax=Exophiala viscosa TaxID=2486360 RepID=UPI0021914A0C|nr:hypothetical protein EDD37DRAFT_644346 [Exophiala viscosa]